MIKNNAVILSFFVILAYLLYQPPFAESNPSRIDVNTPEPSDSTGADDKTDISWTEINWDFFESAYDKDEENKKVMTEKEYLRWIKKFYRGHKILGIVVEKGWFKRVKEFTQNLQDDVECEMINQLLELGMIIAAEWAKDNDVRAITTDDLKTWGPQLKEASINDEGDGKMLSQVIEIIKAEALQKLESRNLE